MLELVIYMTNVQPGQALFRLDKIIFACTKNENYLDKRLTGQRVGQNQVRQQFFGLIEKKINKHDYSEIKIIFLIFKNDTLLRMDLKFYIT